MSFHIGQHVVCVDNVMRGEYLPPASLYKVNSKDMGGLAKGRVYTVRGLTDFHGTPGVYLQEIVRPVNSYGFETPYHAARFRPLDESRLDIFRAHLAPSPKQKERA